MKMILSITGLNSKSMEALHKALEGTKLHFGMSGIEDNYVEQIDILDNRNIDANELTEVIKALRAATWKQQGVGGDAL